MQKKTQLVGMAEYFRSNWMSPPFQNEMFLSVTERIAKHKSIVPGRIQLASEEEIVRQNMVSLCTLFCLQLVDFKQNDCNSFKQNA